MILINKPGDWRQLVEFCYSVVSDVGEGLQLTVTFPGIARGNQVHTPFISSLIDSGHYKDIPTTIICRQTSRPRTDEYHNLRFSICSIFAGRCGSLHRASCLDSNGSFPGEIWLKHLARADRWSNRISRRTIFV